MLSSSHHTEAQFLHRAPPLAPQQARCWQVVDNDARQWLPAADPHGQSSPPEDSHQKRSAVRGSGLWWGRQGCEAVCPVKCQGGRKGRGRAEHESHSGEIRTNGPSADVCGWITSLRLNHCSLHDLLSCAVCECFREEIKLFILFLRVYLWQVDQEQWCHFIFFCFAL